MVDTMRPEDDVAAVRSVLEVEPMLLRDKKLRCTAWLK
jgi:hypothetical protein